MSSSFSHRLDAPPQRNHHARRTLALVFFVSGLLLLVLGLASLGAGWMLRGETLPDRFAWQAPLDTVDERNLDLPTVLLPLTGVPASDALNAALDEGHWENAYAIIAYDSTLTDAARIGALLQLGSRYADSDMPVQSARCYLATARIAVLSPLLSDGVRVDTFMQASAGLRSLGAMDAARLAVDQAYLLVQNSPSLRRESQSRRLTQIANAYTALGAESLGNQAQSKAAELLTGAADEAGFLPREPFVLKAAEPALPDQVVNAQQRRIAAAKQLQDDIQRDGITRAADLPADSVKQLSDALVEEDAARAEFVRQQRARVLEPGIKLTVLRDQVAWLGVKYRVARGAFGARLVPEWEQEKQAIGTAWDEAWGELFNLYENQAASIPNAQAVSQAMEDVTRQELVAVRWGWYSASADELHARLSELAARLREASILTLRVDSLRVNGGTTDLLVPDELIGKNEQALPH